MPGSLYQNMLSQNSNTISQLAEKALINQKEQDNSNLTTDFFVLFFSTEMRQSVTTPGYLFRKALDNILYSLTAQQHVADLSTSQDPFPTRVPDGWLPLYTMVTFRPDISYASVKYKVERQAQILAYASWISAALTVGTVGITCVKVWWRLRARG